MNNSVISKRKINFEVLRIVAMLLIIIHHCTINGLGLAEVNSIDKLNTNHFKYSILSFIECFSIVGVNLFFLLSGYFGIKFKFKKVIILLLNLYFYSTIIRIIGLLLGSVSFNFTTLKEILFPLSIYWFILVYILLMIISPYLNILIENMNYKLYKLFIITIICIFGIFSFVYNSKYIGANGGYSLLSAAYLYVIGGGLKKFSINENKNKYLFLYCLTCICNFIITLIAIYVINNGRVVWKLYSYNNILIILAAIFLFKFFSNISIDKKYEKIILYISNSTLAVYFLHSSSWIANVRNFPLMYLSDRFNVLMLIIPLITYSFFILIICILLDKVKKILIDKLFINISRFLEDKITMLFRILKLI